MPERKYRITGGQQLVDLVTTESRLFVPHSETRCGLIIGGGITSKLYLSFGSPATAIAGVQVLLSHPNMILTDEYFGDLVKGPIYAILVTANETYRYWESHRFPL